MSLQDLSQHLHNIAFLLVLIASVILICKSLWVKSSAKCLNVNVVVVVIIIITIITKTGLYSLSYHTRN